MKEKPILKEAIAQRIIELRKEHNLKQIDLADHLGWTRQNMRKTESGKQNMGTLKLYEICKFFKISLSDFFKSINL